MKEINEIWVPVQGYEDRYLVSNNGTSITRSKEKRSKRIQQFSKDLELIRVYDSISDAERKTGIYNPNIIKCCKGERRTAGGYIWKYEEIEKTRQSSKCNS